MFGRMCCNKRRFLIYPIASKDRSPLVSECSRTPALSVAKMSSGALSSYASPLVDCSRWWKGNCNVGLTQLY